MPKSPYCQSRLKVERTRKAPPQPVVGVGGVPVDGELAKRGVRQAVAQVDVIAGGLAETGVDQRAVQAVDLAVAATGEAAAGGVRTLHVALFQQVGGRLADDGVVDADLPPVQADVQALHEVRAVHQACGPGLGGFRLQFRVGARLEGAVGLGARAGRLRTAGGDLAEVGRNAARLAGCGHRRVARGRAEAAVARIGVGVEGLRRATVHVGDARGAEAGRVGRTHQQVVDRLPLQPELAVGGRTEVVVIRVATSHVQRQFTRERQLPRVGWPLVPAISPFCTFASGV
ncbi:hypothetical protein G6F66_013247 [Rhizopus arrhizus]|nr:hypothetical protein G6F66_013247 [Rhizopus arrhizus]